MDITLSKLDSECHGTSSLLVTFKFIYREVHHLAFWEVLYNIVKCYIAVKPECYITKTGMLYSTCFITCGIYYDIYIHTSINVKYIAI